MAKWCSYYNCFCNDAEINTDGSGDCDYDCDSCEHEEDMRPAIDVW